MIEKLRSENQDRLSELGELLEQAKISLDNRACVYASGSFGRGEATKTSDLDLFIVGAGTQDKKPLPHLDEILIKAELINATRKLEIPDFDGDGRYLAQFSVEQLVESLGKPEDDANNTFTARLLLLLESTPIIGESQHEKAIKTIIGSYWRDYEDHASAFVPVFLANDILRLWRTFCVNYEANTQVITEQDTSKRRLKNYKLKYSRLLTCYSALLYMVARDRNSGTFTKDDALQMCKLSPTGRLEVLQHEAKCQNQAVTAGNLLDRYSNFLDEVAEGPDSLKEKLEDPDERRAHFGRATEFGDAMAEALKTFGKRGTLFRRLLV